MSLSSSPRPAPFADCRSRRVVILAHCILNQNAKLDRCAHCPGAVTGLVDVLLEHGIGIVQMACPEMLALGLDRQTDASRGATVADEDTRIARLMRESPARQVIGQIASDVVQQIADYHRHGFSAIGVVGINGSPTCGVETTWQDGTEHDGYGELIAELSRQLALAGIRLPMRGIRSNNIAHAVETIRALLNTSR